MNKLWKIGTNIEHYIDEIFKFSRKYGDTFFVYPKILMMVKIFV